MSLQLVTGLFFVLSFITYRLRITDVCVMYYIHCYYLSSFLVMCSYVFETPIKYTKALSEYWNR